MESFEPSIDYKRSKRWAIIFSGLLSLSVVVGIEPNDNSSIFPFKLNNVELLSEFLAVGLAYFLYQVVLFWAGQHDEIKSLGHFKVDHRACLMIGGFSLGIWSFEWFEIVLLWLSDKLSFITDISVLIVVPDFIIPLIASVVFVLSAIKGMQARARILVDLSELQATARGHAISIRLLTDKWILIYNPKRREGYKELQFKKDGVIGKGANENEHSWRTRNGLLELLDSSGSVYSRFRYIEPADAFEHTNDSDTRSLPDQRIVKEDQAPASM